MRVLITAIIVSILYLSCKARSSNATPKHTFGVTRVDRSEPLKPCKINTAADLEPIRVYAEKVMHALMAGNSQTFSGTYAPANFCINVLEDENYNALAHGDSGEIEVTTFAVFSANEDSELASLLAHELAHVTMQTGEEPHPSVKNIKQYISAKKALLTLTQANGQKRTDLYKMRESLAEEIRAARLRVVQAVDPDLATQYRGPAEKYKGLLKRSSEISDQLYNVGNEQSAKIATLIKSGETQDSDLIRRVNLSYQRRLLTLQKEQNQLTEEASALSSSLFTLDNKIDDVVESAEKKNPNLASVQELATLRVRLNDVEKERLVLVAEENNIRSEITDIENQNISGEDATTWRETLADEVGLELYLRANFDPLHMGWRHFEDLQGGVFALCRTIAAGNVLLGRISSPFFISHGEGSHPNTCWRYFKTMITEYNEHFEEYKKLYLTAARTTIFPGELMRLKREYILAMQKKFPK